MVNWYRKLEVRGCFQSALILLLINLLVFPPWLTAQVTALTWTGGANDGGEFGTAGNWDPATSPSGTYDAFIQAISANVNLTAGGFALNSMTLDSGDHDNPATLTVSSGSSTALVLSTPNSTTPSSDVLTIGNGGVLNVQNGSGVTLDLSTGGTVTNNGALSISDGAALTVSYGGTGNTPSMTNNATISIGDAGTGSAGSLFLNDTGTGNTLVVLGGGEITLSDNASNSISAAPIVSLPSAAHSAESLPAPTLELNGGTLSGAGTISTNFHNQGTLTATGSNALQVTGSLTNWDGVTLTGGSYIANDGSTLILSSIGSNSIQTISGASLTMGLGGKVTGNGTDVPLSSLTNIINSTVGVNALNGGDASTPYVITPTTGALTMSSGDSATASLTLDQGSNVTVSGGFHNLAYHDSTIQADENLTSNSTLTLDNQSTLTTGAFVNEASVNGPFLGLGDGSPGNPDVIPGVYSDSQSRSATVNLFGGSHLNVASLTMTTDNGGANSFVNLDASTLTAGSEATPGFVVLGGGAGQGCGVVGGSSFCDDTQSGLMSLSLTSGSTATIYGSVTSNSDLNSSTVKLDGGSSMTVSGTFTQNNPQANYVPPNDQGNGGGDFGGQSFLILDNNSTASLGGLTNSTTYFTSTGVPQSHVSVDHGSSLTINGAGTFTNIHPDGTLSGGDYFIGSGSTINYTGTNIGTIDYNTAVTLGGPESLSGDPPPATGQFLNNGQNALTSLRNNYGTLNLNSNANLTIDISDVSSFNNGQAVAVQRPATVTTHDFTAPPPGVINVNDGSTLTIADHSASPTSNINNWGQINLNAASDSFNYTTLQLDGGSNAKTFVLSGTGTLNMTDASGNTIQGVTGNESLTNNSTIQGSGYITNFEKFTNNGTLTAQGFNGIAIDLTNSASISGNHDSFTNDTNGQINIQAGAVLGFISATDTTITNNGAIYINGGCGCEGGAAMLLVDGRATTGAFGGSAPTFTLSGTGSITLDQGGYGEITGVFGTENLVNDTGHTIQGSGVIGGVNFSGVSGGIGGLSSFTNNGTLIADFGHGESQPDLAIDLTGLKVDFEHESVDPDPNESFTNNGEVDVKNGALMGILTLDGKTITNNGTINLGDGSSFGELWLGSSDDGAGQGGYSPVFTLTGTGTVHLTSGDPEGTSSDLEGYVGSESLVNDTQHTISGNGRVDYWQDFTNNGTLRAQGGTLTVDVQNFRNWDGTTGTLSGGKYIADDGAYLQLNNIGITAAGPGIHSNDSLAGPIQTLSGADVTLNGTGLLIDVNGNDALAGLSRIDQGSTGHGSLTLNGAGSPDVPYTITTGQLTVSADDSQVEANRNITTVAALFLDGSNLQISNIDGGYGDFVAQAYSTTGNITQAYTTLVDASSLTVGNLSNTATTGAGGTASAIVGLSGIAQDSELHGSSLTVNGTLTNHAISTDGTGFATASVSISQNSVLTVTGDVNNLATGVAGLGVSASAQMTIDASVLNVTGAFHNTTDPGLGLNGGATLRVQNGSAATVTGAFSNSAESSVAVDASTLSTGVFTNNGQVTLSNGATLNAATATTGGLTNTGTIDIGGVTVFQHGSVSGHVTIATNTLNVTGDLFNTSPGVINVNGDGDSIHVSAPVTTCVDTCSNPQTATGQFVNSGGVNLGGANSSITADSFDNQSGGTTNFNGNGSSVYSNGAASNEGTMNFNTNGSHVGSTGFTNTGSVFVSGGSDVSFDGIDSPGAGTYTQTAGNTTVDTGGTVIGQVDIEGGTFTVGNSIVTKAPALTADGAIDAPGPQSIGIIGDYTQAVSGFMDLDLSVANGYDQLNVSSKDSNHGNVSLDGALNITELGDFSQLQLGTVFHIITWTGIEAGLFSALNYTPLLNGEFFKQMFNVNGVDQDTCPVNSGCTGLDLVVSQVVTGTPEPSTLAMFFGASLLGAGAAWRKRCKLQK